MEEERKHASPEGLRSERDVVSILKHDENENRQSKKHFFCVCSSFL